MKKVGIMGGTFNPIHFGHLFLAENALEQLGLDQILFMPSKNPPHKDKPEDVTEQHRVDMISLAIEGNPHFELSTIELEREGTTYTADTLMILDNQYPDTEYYFIVGADSLFMMHNWMRPQIIFDLCTVIAAGRDNVDKKLLKQQVTYLENNFNAKITLIDMPTIQIASKVIRERIAGRKTVRYYIPDSVYEYITRNKLYLTNQEDIQ